MATWTLCALRRPERGLYGNPSLELEWGVVAYGQGLKGAVEECDLWANSFKYLGEDR